MSTRIKNIDLMELVSMSTSRIRLSLSHDVRGRDIICISTNKKYSDYILCDYIHSIKKCDSIVVIKIPKGTFMGDRMVKINFSSFVIQTDKEVFCC